MQEAEKSYESNLEKMNGKSLPLIDMEKRYTDYKNDEKSSNSYAALQVELKKVFSTYTLFDPKKALVSKKMRDHCLRGIEKRKMHNMLT